MLKRIMVALAALFLMLGLAAAPASGAAEVDGSVSLHEDVLFGTPSVTVPEGDIPDSCESIPAELSKVQSMRNNTFNPGTSVSFYRDENCTIELETVAPNDSNPDINSPEGAEFWQVTPPTS